MSNIKYKKSRKSKIKLKLWIYDFEPKTFFDNCKHCGEKIKLIPTKKDINGKLYVSWQIFDIKEKHDCWHKEKGTNW